MLREGEGGDLRLFPSVMGYYKAEGEIQAIMKEYYPHTTLSGQELLKRVANVVGLQLPKEVKLQQ